MPNKSDKQFCPTKTFSKNACIFALFYWAQVTKYVKVTKFWLSSNFVRHCFVR